MRTKSSLRMTAALAVLVLAMASCGTDDPLTAPDGPEDANGEAEPADGEPDPADGEPRAGGELVFSQHGNPLTLDPGLIRGTQGTLPEAQAAAAVFDTLIYQVAETGEVVGHIAESLDTDDGVTWTLRLREGVRFHDGTDLDAEAVKFNWERALDEELSSPHRALVASIESLTVTDPLTLEIVLSDANAQFHRSVAQQLAFIGSPTAIQELGEDFARNPVGAGPFRFVEWVPDDRLVLERNDDYWNAPEPYLDRVVFRPTPDSAQALNAIGAGEMNAQHDSSALLLDRARQLGIEVTTIQLHGAVTFAMNYERVPFDDIRVRRAVSHGFDLDRHNQVVNDGLHEVADTLFADGHELYSDVRVHTYDSQRAQELFNEVAAELEGPVTFEIGCFPGTGQERMCESLQSQMLEFDNVQATVDVAESAVANRRIVGRDYQIHLFGFNIIDAEPLMSQYFHSDGPLNVASWKNPEADEIIEAARRTLDVDERRELYARLAEIWAEEIPQILTFRHRTYRYTSPDVRGQAFFQDNWLWGPLWLDR